MNSSYARVSVAIAVAAMSACATSHLGGEEDAAFPTWDGSFTRDAHTGDGSVGDAATDARTVCEPPNLARLHRPDWVCEAASTRESSRMRVMLSGCYCASEFTCELVETGDHELSLVTTGCQNPGIDCGCAIDAPPAMAECEVPVLSAGRWTVRVDGTPAFDFVPQSTPLATACHQVAPPHPDVPGTTTSTFCPWPSAVPTEVPRLCTWLRGPSDRHVPFEFEYGLPDCFADPGDCEVALLPPNILLVTPRVRACECPVCGVCPPAIYTVPVTCHSPRLSAGEYEVQVPGGDPYMLTVAPGADVFEYCDSTAG